MDPNYSLQDVIRCKLLKHLSPPLYCELCHINLCKTFAGEHLLDESQFHIIVPIKHRQSIRKISCPECQNHTAKLVEHHCKQCDVSVCVQCFSSKKHDTHDVVDILKFLERKNQTLQAHLEELGKVIYPKYQEIASSFPVQRADLKRNIENLILSINKRGEEWHREIDNIISKLKSDIEKTESQHLTDLKNQENEINHAISEIIQTIGELKTLKGSNDVSLLSKYKSRNAEFRIFPPKLSVSLPSFSSQRINTKQLSHQFGSLTIFSITTEKRPFTKSRKPKQRIDL